MSAQPSDFDKDATSDEGIWREAAARLRIATEAESENRIKGIAAKKFRWGEQWDGDVRNVRKIDGRPALTINHTNTFCARLENTLRQQRPRIKCHPVGDGANVDTAATVNGLIRHIEDRSNASVAYDTGVANAIDIGWGYWRIVSEYLDPRSFDQELLIKPIRNPFTVYMDPSAVMPDGRDQGWCLISETMKRAEYKRKYPKADNVEWRYVDAPGDMVTDWESKEELRLAEYYRIHEVRDTLVKFSDGSTRLRSEFASEDAMAAIAAVGLTIVAERPTTRREVQWFRLNGKTIVDRRVLPGEHIPVVRCEGNVMDVNGRVMRKGMVEDLKDPAQMFNYWRTAQTERYALTPKAPWVVAEGQIDGHPEWNDANQKSYSTLIYKPVTGPDGVTVLPPPQRVSPAQVEAGMSEAAQGAEHDLMSVAGMPQENPEISARVVSGNKYLQRRQGMQDLTHFQYYDNQTLAIAWTGSLILELIPYYYDTQRMQRILGEDGVPQMITLNERAEEDGITRVKNDMTIGRYAVVMDTGPGYATKREEAAESLVELLGTPLGEQVAKTSGDIVVRNMDFPGSDQVADRIAVTIPGALDKIMEGLPKQAQTIIGSMQAQMQELQQQNQQLSLEIKYQAGIKQMQDEGATQRELIKAGVADANSQRDAEGWRHENDLDATTRVRIEQMKGATARDVAEIHGAASLLNTHAEAQHEKEAAKEMIKAGTQDRREGAEK
jgi:hypothetical protein